MKSTLGGEERREGERRERGKKRRGEKQKGEREGEKGRRGKWAGRVDTYLKVIMKN